MKRLLRSLFFVVIVVAIILIVKFFGTNFIMLINNSGDSIDYSIDTPVKKYESVNSEEEVMYALDRMQYNLQPAMIIRYTNIEMNKLNLDDYLQTNNNIANVDITYSADYINIKLEYRLWFQVSQMNENDFAKENVSTNALGLDLVAKEILDSIITNTMTDYEKEKVIHDYIVLNTSYGNKSGDNAYNIKGVLEDRIAVCQGYAETFKMFMDLVGIECHLVLGVASEDHEWNMVKLGGEYYHVDVTWDDPTPDEVGKVSYLYFNVSDDMIGQDHTWERDNYPECDAIDYNYFYKEGIWVDSLDALEEKVYNDFENNKKEIEIFCGFDIEEGLLVSDIVISHLKNFGYYGKIQYTSKDNYCKIVIE